MGQELEHVDELMADAYDDEELDTGSDEGDEGEGHDEGEHAQHGEEEGEGETGEGEGSEQGEDEGKPKTMPVAAHVEERKRWKEELEAERRRNAQYQTLEAELRAMREQMRPKPEPEQPKAIEVPPIEEDLEGHIQALYKQGQQSVEQMQAQLQQVQQQTQQQQFQQQLVSTIAQHEQQFVATNPDYYDALQHVRAVELAKLEAFGVTDVTEQQKHLNDYELNMAYQALQRGISPAQWFYNVAQKAGYAKAAPAPTDEPDAIDRAKAKQAAKGMGGDGEAPTVKDMLDLEEDEFEAAMREAFGHKPKGRFSPL